MKRANSIKLALRRGASRALVLGPLTFLLVAGAGCPSLFDSPSQRAVKVKQAVPGTDQAKNVTSTTGETVNGYARLGADVNAGGTTVTFSNADTIFGTLAKGDLLLIIQMQGATLTDSSCTSSSYGEVSNEDLGSAGQYEFVGVEAVSGTAITLACALKHSYVRDAGTQLIRVPQYTSLTVASDAYIKAPAWNGTTGGVAAVHVEETARLNNTAGSVNVSGLGFRGGATDNVTTAAGTAVTIYCGAGDGALGAQKGEGIAGDASTYPGGPYGRGAAANAGGGGNSHNAGGGGGANASVAGTWTGFGVMEKCGTGADWNTAWRQESTTCSDSPGAGRGGYSYSDPTANPTPTPNNTGPGISSWGGNYRRQVGGLGGRPLPADPAQRLFMGGGGGAGDGNNNRAGAGGPGGGIVFLIAGQVTGAGSIVADGAQGGDALFTPDGDAAGGGGGGGTVLVNAGSIANTISISAKGGRGGNQGSAATATWVEVEGPGGGGGGGYIAVSGTGTPSAAADGGVAGQTRVQTMSTFPPDGATAGHAGVTYGDASTMLFCGALPVTRFVIKPPVHSKDRTATFTFANTVDPVTYRCRLDSPTGAFVACNGPDAAAGVSGFVTTDLEDGPHTLYVQSTDSHGNVESPPATYAWIVDTVTPVTSFATAPTDPSISAVGVFVFQASETPVTYECRLDSTADTAWLPCNAGTFENPDPNYQTAPLANGPHTLWVRATDQAGNLEADPPHWPWNIAVVYLDAGAPDVEGPKLDVEYLDVEEPIDTRPADVSEPEDTQELLDTELVKDDVPSVEPDTAKEDLPIVVVLDAERLDTELLDVGLRDIVNVGGVDLGLDLTAGEDGVVSPGGPEPSPDTAPAFGPEPSPDTAPPATEPDAAVPQGNEDAAESRTDNRVLGGGFCAVSASRSASPAGFALLALAALALLRRRRR